VADHGGGREGWTARGQPKKEANPRCKKEGGKNSPGTYKTAKKNRLYIEKKDTRGGRPTLGEKEVVSLKKKEKKRNRVKGVVERQVRKERKGGRIVDKRAEVISTEAKQKSSGEGKKRKGRGNWASNRTASNRKNRYGRVYFREGTNRFSKKLCCVRKKIEKKRKITQEGIV